MKPSIVAMFGWIMPDPLLMPVMRVSPPESSTVVVTVFGTKSVVKIARAKFSAVSSVRESMCPIAGRILPRSSGWPITPVEAVRTSRG